MTECVHCGELRALAEKSIWCADCLKWWRESYRLFLLKCAAEEAGAAFCGAVLHIREVAK